MARVNVWELWGLIDWIAASDMMTKVSLWASLCVAIAAVRIFNNITKKSDFFSNMQLGFGGYVGVFAVVVVGLGILSQQLPILQRVVIALWIISLIRIIIDSIKKPY